VVGAVAAEVGAVVTVFIEVFVVAGVEAGVVEAGVWWASRRSRRGRRAETDRVVRKATSIEGGRANPQRLVGCLVPFAPC
jgi:hypothetical protein